MGKREFVLRRIVQLFVLYIAIATMLFFLFRAAPGNPMANFIGQGFTEAQAEAVRERYGLNDPIHVQYGKFLWNALTLNFGRSYTTAKPVMTLINDRIWNTVILMGSSIVLAYLIGVPLGAYLAWNRGKPSEKIGVLFTLVSRSAPVFWTGLLAIWVFGLQLDLLPAGSMTSPESTFDGRFELYTSADFLSHLILPALVQAFYYYSLPALLMRNSMLEVMNEEFVKFAELKGISDRRVMLKHAARNALLPVVTAFAIAAGYAIGGSVVIETVFAWPGLGRLMVNSVVAANYPVSQGTFLILAAMVLLMNFVADMAYGYLDPRITYE